MSCWRPRVASRSAWPGSTIPEAPGGAINEARFDWSDCEIPAVFIPGAEVEPNGVYPPVPKVYFNPGGAGGRAPPPAGTNDDPADAPDAPSARWISPAGSAGRSKPRTMAETAAFPVSPPATWPIRERTYFTPSGEFANAAAADGVEYCDGSAPPMCNCHGPNEVPWSPTAPKRPPPSTAETLSAATGSTPYWGA